MQLKNFPVGKSPPMVYMTGQRSISVTNKEVEILREYLLDKQGMLLPIMEEAEDGMDSFSI